VVIGEEFAVDVGVLVHADCDYGDVGHAFLHLEQAGQLFDAGGAPGGPEVQDDDLAAQLAEVDGSGAVAHDEQWGRLADVAGMRSAVAACNQQHTKCNTCPESTHDTLHFL